MAKVADSPIVDTPDMYEGLSKIPVDLIRVNPANPRRDAKADDALLASVTAVGILEPLIVRPFEEDGVELYMLLAGHRRLDAARQAGFTRVPAVERDADEATALEVMLVENLARQDLNPIEEAVGVEALVSLGRTQRQVAELLGVSQSHVSKRLSLLKLPVAARDAVDSGSITVEDGIDLAKLPEKETAKLFKGDKIPQAHQISSALYDMRRKEKVAKAKAAAEAAGLTIVKQVGWNRAHPPCRVDYLGLEKGFDHILEPCHAVYINDYNGSTVECCTEPSRHPEAERDEPPRRREQPAQNETPEEKAEREARDARRDAIEAGGARREAFVKNTLAGKPIAEEVISLAAHVLPQMADFDGTEYLELLGRTDVTWDNCRTVALQYLDSPGEQLRLLHAMGMAAGERLVREALGEYVTDDELAEIRPGARRYLIRLRDLGYSLDEFESELAGEQLTLDVGTSGAEADSDEAWEASAKVAAVTVTAPKGRQKMWMIECSEHGVIGRNTKEAMANERAEAHRAEHGIKS